MKKSKIVFKNLDYSNIDEIKEIAYLHEKAPENWINGHKPSDKEVQSRFNVLMKNKERDEVLIILAKNENNKIVGMHWIKMDIKNNLKCGHIISLWVDKKYRNVGIGKDLKLKGEEWAKKMGAKLMLTEVFYNNENMIKYNIKLGYEAKIVEMTKSL